MRGWTPDWCSSATRARRDSAPRPWSRGWCTATCPTAIRTSCRFSTRGLPDLNLTELFRTNRYVGEDRIGDANQVALALTTRLFDTVSGAQYLSATIGQIRYFSIPRVGLPDDVLLQSAGQTLVTVPGVNPLDLPGQALVNSRGQSSHDHCPGQYVSGLPSRLWSAAAAATAQAPEHFPASDIVADVLGDGLQALQLQFRLPVESLHLANRQVGGLAPVPPGSQPGW